MNVAVFTATAILGKQNVKITRICFGSALGAVYACLAFVTDWQLTGFFLTKLLVTFILTAIVFKPRGIRPLLAKTALFFSVSAGYALVLLGVLYFTDIGLCFGGAVKSGVFYFNIPLWFMVPASFGAPCIAYILQKKLSRSPLRDCFVLTIEHLGKKVRLTVLSDTGNFLQDPYNGNDVIAVEAKAVKPIFENTDFSNLDYINLPPDFRLIPYSSLGNSSGTIPGFTPHSLRADGQPIFGVTIGIYAGTLCQNGEYNGVSKPISYIKKGYNSCSEKSLLS